MAIPTAIPLSLSIKECKCTKFSFTEFAKSNKSIIPPDQYLFTFNFGLNIREMERLVAIKLDSTLTGNSPEVKENIASIETNHHFLVNNFEDVTIKKNYRIEMYDQVLMPFLSISLSNLRGMFAIKLEDSIYSNAIVPLVDVSQLLPKIAPPIG